MRRSCGIILAFFALTGATSQDPRDRGGYGPAVTIGPTKYQKSGPGNCR